MSTKSSHRPAQDLDDRHLLNSPHSRRDPVMTRSTDRKLLSPPTSFSTRPETGKSRRSDSPTPLVVHHYGSPTLELPTTSSSDDELPPSISQRIRRLPRSREGRGLGRHGEQGKEGKVKSLKLPVEEGRGLKQKRSFERTKAWAEEAERMRNQAGTEVCHEGAVERLIDMTTDLFVEGSSTSTIPPRTLSPAPSAQPPAEPGTGISPQLVPSQPVLSIDDIIRLHAATANRALTAAKDKARRELGMPRIPRRTSPNTPTFSLERSVRDNAEACHGSGVAEIGVDAVRKGSNGSERLRNLSQGSPPTTGSTETDLSESRCPPPIPSRKSSTPDAKVHVIPDRTSSFNSPTFVKEFNDNRDLDSPSALSTERSLRFDVSKEPPRMREEKDRKGRASVGNDIQADSSGQAPERHSFASSQTAVESETSKLAVPTKTYPSPKAPSIASTPSPHSHRIQPSTSPAVSETHELALLLRSAPLNQMLTLPRPYPLRSLRISYAEVGKPNGHPILFFLGLSCVRYLIAMYESVALAFGLRLICVDRWGYGRTDQVDALDKGPLEWAAVIQQVVKELGVGKFQVVAHSAGVPYAMAVARRYPEMVKGRIHLLAPWIGQEHESVTRWSKWVPETVIKTATAADHRIQSLVMGKAPKLHYAPIESNVSSPVVVAADNMPEVHDSQRQTGRKNVKKVRDEFQLSSPRPPNKRAVSATPTMTSRNEAMEEAQSPKVSSSRSLIQKASNAFSSRRGQGLYGSSSGNSTVLSLSLSPKRSSTMPTTPSTAGKGRSERSSLGTPTEGSSGMERSPGLKNLKNLAGMRSAINILSTPPSFNRSQSSSSTASNPLPITPETTRSSMSTADLDMDFGLGDGFSSFGTDLALVLPAVKGRSIRSIKIMRDRSRSTISGSSRSSNSLAPSTNSNRTTPLEPTVSIHSGISSAPAGQQDTIAPSTEPISRHGSSIPVSSFPSTPAFAQALLQASHAECQPGTTSDLLSIILDKPHRPWGFRYQDITLPSTVWVGTEDRLISDRSVRWMEENCGSVVMRLEGEGHNLMSCPGVVLDVFIAVAKETRER